MPARARNREVSIVGSTKPELPNLDELEAEVDSDRMTAGRPRPQVAVSEGCMGCLLQLDQGPVVIRATHHDPTLQYIIMYYSILSMYYVYIYI